MIDEKKLIEEINKKLETTSISLQTVEIILNIIKSQPKVGEWIPVEERLPKHYGQYLITAINDYEGIYMAVSSYDSQYKSFSSDGVEDDIAIAWMDLPKMYEVKDNERP